MKKTRYTEEKSRSFGEPATWLLGAGLKQSGTQVSDG